MSKVISPLTGSDKVRKVSSLNIPKLIKNYADDYQLDVSRFFVGVDELAIYQCQSSGLKFYYPFQLAGDGKFYSELSRNYKGYYNPWKWEHAEAASYVNEGDRVLEIGCGNGYFLKEIQKRGAIPLGLDLNPDAVEQGKKLGVQISDQPVSQHAVTHAEVYDVVCAFQLFEHVNEVGTFLGDTIRCLRPGGKLIIGVPNNDSQLFIRDPYHTLNLPPHHMLLWDSRSLGGLTGCYPLEVVGISSQPVSKIDRSLIYRLWLEQKMGSGAFSSFVHAITRVFVKNLPLFPSEGATVLAIYKKS